MEVADVVGVLGGVSLAGGLYRVFAPPDVQSWTTAGHLGFPALPSTIVFAADWLGRLFAADTERLDGSRMPMVVLLEPGTGEALELPVSVAGLHTSELVAAPEAALAASFYAAWRAASGDEVPLRLDECVGYRVPLFLGGSDEVGNLERTDMDVYWALFGQMREQTSGLPVRTQVSRVMSEEPERRLFRRGR